MTMKRNDDAVSPVIGVILMVAITVILAAVIAAFVFGLVGGVQGAKVVGLTVAENQTGYGVITWQGGADMSSLVNVSYTLDGGSRGYLLSTPPTVGTTNVIPAIGGKKVIIVGKFGDGSEQVIFDKQF